MGLANSLMKEKRSDQGKSNREAVLLIQIMEVLAKNITPDDELLLRLQNSFILTIFENNTTGILTINDGFSLNKLN